MKIIKILFITLICISALESNASTTKLDKSQLIKEMSNNPLVQTYVENILSLALITASQNIPKLPDEIVSQLDRRMKNTIEYGKSIELFFPAYGNLSTIEKKEVIQQVTLNHFNGIANFSLEDTEHCVRTSAIVFAKCLGIVLAADLIIFIGCAVVSALITAVITISSGGTLAAGALALIGAEMAACAAWAAPIVAGSIGACTAEFAVEIHDCSPSN